MRSAPQKAEQGRDLYTGQYLKHDLRREHESRQILNVIGNVCSEIEELGSAVAAQECGEECVCERIERILIGMYRNV